MDVLCQNYELTVLSLNVLQRVEWNIKETKDEQLSQRKCVLFLSDFLIFYYNCYWTYRTEKDNVGLEEKKNNSQAIWGLINNIAELYFIWSK